MVASQGRGGVGLRRDFAEADQKWWCWARSAERDRAKRPWPAALWGGRLPDLGDASRTERR